MSTDTDTSSDSASSSEEEKKRHKSSKHRKHKSDNKQKKKKKKQKKETKYREKKLSKHEERIDIVAEHLQTSSAFGPALPPHMLQKKLPNKNVEKRVIGPIVPEELKASLQSNNTEEDVVEEKAEKICETTAAPVEVYVEEEYEGYGPMPVSGGLNATQVELEQRALELKLAAMEGRSTSTVDIKTREEWMLELPEVGLRGGLAALTTMKRTFYQGKERPDFSDRSDWTKTPQSLNKDKIQEKSSKAVAEEQKRDAEATYVRKRDEEQERIAKSHKKKHKLEESLVEIHRKKLRKEQKKKEKELLKSGSKPERRPFTRDVDLKLNKIDSHQTKQIVDKAKILHSKFSSGQAKYL